MWIKKHARLFWHGILTGTELHCYQDVSRIIRGRFQVVYLHQMFLYMIINHIVIHVVSLKWWYCRIRELHELYSQEEKSLRILVHTQKGWGYCTSYLYMQTQPTRLSHSLLLLPVWQVRLTEVKQPSVSDSKTSTPTSTPTVEAFFWEISTEGFLYFHAIASKIHMYIMEPVDTVYQKLVIACKL
jgi:hypothetical protein